MEYERQHNTDGSESEQGKREDDESRHPVEESGSLLVDRVHTRPNENKISHAAESARRQQKEETK